MKIKFKAIILLVFTMCIMLGLNTKTQAKSYTIEDMDIQATIQNNGDVYVKQNITYDFKGSYNGIYITIPYVLNDTEYKKAVQNNIIDEELYYGTGVEVQSVFMTQNGIKIQYSERNQFDMTTSQNKSYTITEESNLKKIKVYSPSTDTTKSFEINYIIKNLCVKHNDVGELYYNFIGGEWDVGIKKLNIDIYLNQNKEEIKIWGHGPYNGISEIISPNHANFKVEDIKKGQYVATRIMFNKDNIINSTKTSGINAEQIILADENEIYENREEKNKYTNKMAIFAGCLFIYWVILMLIFEKDKKYFVSDIDEDELFRKYNPILAGCIQGSRNILARDIIAVILNLIQKKCINLEIIPSLNNKEDYRYEISKNTELESNMDSIEKYVYDWVFEKQGKLDLKNRLEEMPKETQANQKFKDLNNIVENNLSKIGANKASVPMVLRGFNIFLFILSIVLIIKHISFNGFDIYNSEISNIIIKNIIEMIIILLPLIMGILMIPINLIIMLRHKMNKTIQRITGQKVVTTTMSIILIFAIIIIATVFITKARYLIVDEILICIGTILILTDNLMLKNSVTMIEDYSKLNSLKTKIEEYSLMEDRDIEYITLWEKYLAYAVSFGIANKIVKRIKGLHLDDDLEKIVNSANISNFITSDYYYFYTYASLDRRFAKSYWKATKGITKTYISAAGSSRSGGGGGFSGGGGYSGGGGRGGGGRSLLNCNSKISRKDLVRVELT